MHTDDKSRYRSEKTYHRICKGCGAKVELDREEFKEIHEILECDNCIKQ